LLYALSGPVWTLVMLRQRRGERRAQRSSESQRAEDASGDGGEAEKKNNADDFEK